MSSMSVASPITIAGTRMASRGAISHSIGEIASRRARSKVTAPPGSDVDHALREPRAVGPLRQLERRVGRALWLHSRRVTRRIQALAPRAAAQPMAVERHLEPAEDPAADRHLID